MCPRRECSNGRKRPRRPLGTRTRPRCVLHNRCMRRSIALLALLAACSSGGAPATAPSPSGSAPPVLADCRPDGLISIGEALPDCAFEMFDGTVLELTSLRGKPAILNFWASWCTFCIKEMPDFARFHDDFRDKVAVVGFDLVGVEGEIESAARSFAKDRGATYDLAFDPEGLLFAHFSVRPTLPATVFVDERGIVTHRRFGPLDEEQLRELASEHLGVR